MVDRVKRSESGMITDPITTTPDATIEEVDELCAKYRISGLPVVDDDGRLVGIVTNRDMRFVSGFERQTTLVKDVMTTEGLITAQVGIGANDVIATLRQAPRREAPAHRRRRQARRPHHDQGLRQEREVPARHQGRAGPPARRRRDRLLRRRVAARRGAARRGRRRPRRRHRQRPVRRRHRHRPPPQGRPDASPTSTSSAATSRRARARRRSSTRASMPSRSASDRARSARPASSPASACPRSRRSTRPPSPLARRASRSSPTAGCSTRATSPRRSSPAPTPS